MVLLAVLSVTLVSAVHAQAPDAVAAPIVKVGDSWTYARTDKLDRSRNAKYIISVKSLSAAGHTVGREIVEGTLSGADDEFTSDLNPISLEGQKFSPFIPMFSFPLTVGKQWDGRYSFYTTVELSGQRSSKVEGFENVRVPAGEFKAIRITANVSTRAPSGFGSNMQQTLWYAPDVRRLIRAETKIFGAANARDEVIELVAFKLVD
jgi:hypothetical protein